MSALSNGDRTVTSNNPVTSVYIERAPGGWTMKHGGPRRYFGTSYMALKTAICSARAALAAGRPTSVMIERPDGGWRTAWSPDEPYLA